MATMISLRLDDETRRGLDRIAVRRKATASRIVREAIEKYIRDEQGSSTFYDSISGVAGSVHSGKGYLSRDTGRQVAALLKERNPGRKKA